MIQFSSGFCSMEIWKDVKGYEGYYEVSNYGNVKSLERMVKGRYNLRVVNQRILKAGKGSSGYLLVVLRRDGISKSKRVHQLVAESFLNHTPCGYKLVVNHIDFNKINNNVSNLEIVTNRENCNQKHRESKSKYTGVAWNKRNRVWQSYITIGVKNLYLGSFKCELAAAKAYQNALNNL